MSADTVHGYLQAGRSLSPVADWAVNQAITYGPGVLLVGILLGLWCATGATVDAIDRIRYRRAAAAALPDTSASEGLEQLEDELAAMWQRMQDEPRKETP